MHLVPHLMLMSYVIAQPAACLSGAFPWNFPPPGAFLCSAFCSIVARLTLSREAGKHLDLSNKEDCMVKCQNECGGQKRQLEFSEKVKSRVCENGDETLVGT